MASNTSLNFDINELIQLNSDVENSRNSIKTTFSNIKGGFDTLKTNITGTQVNNLITTITDNITAVDNKMTTAFEELSSFLNGQMQNYTNTYEGALSLLNNALSFIDSNFQ